MNHNFLKLDENQNPVEIFHNYVDNFFIKDEETETDVNVSELTLEVTH